MPILVLAILFALYAILMHAPIFFNGICPLFGFWLTGLQGVLALDIAIASLACLAWGTLKQRIWAWWGAIAFLVLFTLSTVLTLMPSSFAEILSLMNLPPREMQMLAGVPLQGIHVTPFIAIPLVITLSVVILSRRHFGRPT